MDRGMLIALQRFPAPILGEWLRVTMDGGEILVEWTGDEVNGTKLTAAHAILREARRAADAERTT